MIPKSLIQSGQSGRIDYSQNIAAFDRHLYDQTLAYVKAEYQTLNAGQIEALVYLHSLKDLETVGHIKAIIQLRRLYAAYHKQVYLAAGFDSIYDWLDSFGLNGKSGTLSQLLRLAIEVIPWCRIHKLTIGNDMVNLDWFCRVIDNKCVASRATLVLSFFRQVLRAGATIDDQKQAIGRALAAVANSQYTRSYLTATFSGYSSPEPITAYRIGQSESITIEATPEQSDWIQKRLAGALSVSMTQQPFFCDQGYTWFNYDSLIIPFNEWRLKQ